jgi:hypothetical protein
LPNAATKTIEIHEHKVKDDAGNSFNRSNYVVQNWPVLEGGTSNKEEEDEQDAEESGAVATEIVVGKRYDNSGYSTSEIGMLSMDGKFSIYDLKSKTTSQRDLFVTHKLFSLATLNVSNRVEEVHNTNTNTAHQHLHSHYQHSSFKSSQHPRSTNSLLSPSGSHHSSKLSLVTPDYPNSISNRRKSHHNNASNDTDNDDGYDEEEDAYSEANDEDYTDDDDDNLINEEEDDSDYESVPWSEKSETEEAPDCDLFVACAWNGVTYLIDWSKRTDDDDESSSQSSSASESDDELQPLKSKIKYQLVKFAFEGRVCAFTAGKNNFFFFFFV